MWLHPCQRQNLEEVQDGKRGMVHIEYLVSCNKQRSRHQLQPAQTCREDPDKCRIGLVVWPTLWKSLKGVHLMGAPPRSVGIGLSPLWKGHLIRRRMIRRLVWWMATCPKVGRAPPSGRLLAPGPNRRTYHRVLFLCKLRWCWESEPLRLHPYGWQHRRAELRRLR